MAGIDASPHPVHILITEPHLQFPIYDFRISWLTKSTFATLLVGGEISKDLNPKTRPQKPRTRSQPEGPGPHPTIPKRSVKYVCDHDHKNPGSKEPAELLDFLNLRTCANLIDCKPTDALPLGLSDFSELVLQGVDGIDVLGIDSVESGQVDRDEVAEERQGEHFLQEVVPS